MGGGNGWSDEPGKAGLSKGMVRPDLGLSRLGGVMQRGGQKGWSTDREPKNGASRAVK